MKVKDKIIAVTGAGNGLGRELVLELLTRGAKVAAIDINGAGLEETVSLCKTICPGKPVSPGTDYKKRISTYITDITDKQAVEALPGKIISDHGSVDGIINNAGIVQPFVQFKDLDYEKIKKVFDVNFFGTLSMTKTFLPYLLKRPEAHITNISSMGGFFPFPGQIIYGASKAAVKIMTEGLYSECINTPVRVTVVFPGAIGTNIIENSGLQKNTAMERLQKKFPLLTPRKAAGKIIKGIEKNRYKILVGADASLMNFMYKINPRGAVKLMYRLMKSLLS